MNENAIEIYESPDGKARFYFSHSDINFTTGVLVLKAGAALPKHNRPQAVESLTQIVGKCLITLFDENDKPTEIELTVGEGIRIHKGQWHIHANPYDEVSVTLFRAEGNILEIMQTIRNTNKRITTNSPKNIYRLKVKKLKRLKVQKFLSFRCFSRISSINFSLGLSTAPTFLLKP